jgi:hypothetical protein
MRLKLFEMASDYTMPSVDMLNYVQYIVLFKILLGPQGVAGGWLFITFANYSSRPFPLVIAKSSREELVVTFMDFLLGLLSLQSQQVVFAFDLLFMLKLLEAQVLNCYIRSTRYSWS